METRTIGSLEVSVVGLGCNNFGGPHRAAGDRRRGGRRPRRRHHPLRHGRHLRRRPERGVPRRRARRRRDEIVLATKFGVPYEDHEGGASPAYVRRPLEDSLTPARAPTASTSTSSTSPTRRRPSPRPSARSASWWPRARYASSAAPTSRRRSSRRPLPPRPTGAPASSASRTSTASSTASPRTRSSACDRTGRPSSPTSPWPTELLSGKYRPASRRRRGPAWPAWTTARPASWPTSASPRWRRWTSWPPGGPHRPGPGHRLAALAARRGLGHRRRHPARAGHGERRRRSVDPGPTRCWPRSTPSRPAAGRASDAAWLRGAVECAPGRRAGAPGPGAPAGCR